MTIETKFNINDLVQTKYQREVVGEHMIALEVIEIKCVNCYTTAQIFYLCRPLHAIMKHKIGDVKNEAVDIVMGRYKDQEYSQFREDELKPCSEKVANIIRNNIEKSE